MSRFHLPLYVALFGFAAPLSAAIEISFQDGNPWDVFIITHDGCPIIRADLKIDLSTSIAGVLIDTEYGGPGTQDPMPPEMSQGDAKLTPVMDGDQHLSLSISKLGPDDPITLRLDVDDTAGSQYAPKVQVYGDEITGATVTLIYAGHTTRGTFDASGYAYIPLSENAPVCELIS